MPERQVNFASSADVSVVSGHTLDAVLSLLMASREVECPRHRAVVNRRPRRVLDATREAKSAGVISRFFSPGHNDPAFHIEVPQP